MIVDNLKNLILSKNSNQGVTPNASIGFRSNKYGSNIVCESDSIQIKATPTITFTYTKPGYNKT
ncbi:hypothetical protein DDB_G0289767 [Dictyostelium discoideum AX4]|uniref:Uncharacterized protein DDB_G0289767 n=1 Tax=Dictyostelium discoideum TaxID=44689 RepID=Y8571_DICDI|nr:hypothetical protein DDB_G0289767 [Dictyostelium discoideum AX4]Q54H10.1 RecName: Full=Uncharacterized protein DDB_G0289767 [Dictyostelium discoideum]EAL62595.1 hypothetical protein DDB_G0289767 [Dictyostelium discoideum AX4]|eukprot:XP_636108.1 hypothetical protein DDB_G0289767 [Dictyostelium discoideum AX4]